MKERLFSLGRPILNYGARIAQRLLPGHCLVCQARAPEHNLCPGCQRGLPYLPRERCPRCAAPSHANAICGACLAHPPLFERVLAPCVYAFPLDRIVQAFKYDGELAAAPLLAHLMLPEIRAAERPELIIPMPLSRERLRERGFNQALELARLIATELRIPLDPNACRRVLHTVPQSGLAWDQRADNVRGAFVCMEALQGRSIAVVDDVLTTGATLNELARVLRRQGAAQVSGWVAVRTLGHSA